MWDTCVLPGCRPVSVIFRAGLPFSAITSALPLAASLGAMVPCIVTWTDCTLFVEALGLEMFPQLIGVLSIEVAILTPLCTLIYQPLAGIPFFTCSIVVSETTSPFASATMGLSG